MSSMRSSSGSIMRRRPQFEWLSSSTVQRPLILALKLPNKSFCVALTVSIYTVSLYAHVPILIETPTAKLSYICQMSSLQLSSLGWESAALATRYTAAGLALYASALASRAVAAACEWQEKKSVRESAWETRFWGRKKSGKDKEAESKERAEERAPLSLQWFDKSYYFIISPWA